MKIGDKFFERVFINSETGERKVILWTIAAIDVGINRDSNGKLCGDIDKEIYDEFQAVTSVPGGVGLITVLEVIRNSIECYKRHMEKK